MVSEQPTRKMVREFKDAGWSPVRTVGSHTVYECATGEHSFSLPDGHKTISPGVVRKARQALTNCKH
jgi:predicted RNA binding protein YcfA (HicA-like mRNA interferase family)